MIEQNPDFAAWTRSCSFAINLSEWAITEILIMESYCKGEDEPAGVAITSRFAWSYLMRKGLCRRSKKDGFQGLFVLTEAGKAMAQLLRCAGFALPG